jgi:hypothetical protein
LRKRGGFEQPPDPSSVKMLPSAPRCDGVLRIGPADDHARLRIAEEMREFALLIAGAERQVNEAGTQTPEIREGPASACRSARRRGRRQRIRRRRACATRGGGGKIVVMTTRRRESAAPAARTLRGWLSNSAYRLAFIGGWAITRKRRPAMRDPAIVSCSPTRLFTASGDFAAVQSGLRFLLLLASACAFADAGVDYIREGRWSQEVLATLVVGNPSPQHTATPRILALHTELSARRGSVIIVHGLGVHPDWDIGGVRTLLAEAGYATLHRCRCSPRMRRATISRRGAGSGDRSPLPSATCAHAA